MSKKHHQTELKRTSEDIPKEEIDLPLKENVDAGGGNELIRTKLKDRGWFSTIEGHKLLLICIGLVVVIYIVELYCSIRNGRNGNISEIGKTVIEILKMLIFSLTGYLFGTHGKNEE